MIEIITKWNLTRPDEIINDFIENITLRGYIGKNVNLTGEFKALLKDEKIKPLSVGNIADKICPTRRDLYFIKGLQKVKVTDKDTWGRKTGKLTEEYLYELYKTSVPSETNKYKNIKINADSFTNSFIEREKENIESLIKLELETFGSQEGDTDWLLKFLTSVGRGEYALKLLHNILKESDDIDLNDIEIERNITPNILQIGINAPTSPDFVIPKHSIIGDIKTGLKFEIKYQLTCAGYAMAYENETNKNINWGVIYFIPTRTTYRYGRVLTYPQIHIFPIDEKLRQWFLDNRDEAYGITSNKIPPSFPHANYKHECPYCKYKDHCITEGLELS